MDIGKRIQDRRKELNLSVEDVAKRLSKNRTTVYRYEKGDIGNLPLETLKPLAEILETTPAYLMGWDEKQEDMSPEPDLIGELIDMINAEEFTEHEHQCLFEYARFLVYRRSIE